MKCWRKWLFASFGILLVAGWGCATKSRMTEPTEHAAENRSERIADPRALMKQYREPYQLVDLDDEELLESGGVPRSSVLLTPVEYDELLRKGETAVIFIGSPYCGSAKRLAQIVEEVLEGYAIGTIYSIAYGHRSYDTRAQLPLHHTVVPMFIVISGGAVVDIQVGTERVSDKNKISVQNLLIRNGFVEGEIKVLYDYKDRSDEQVRQILTRNFRSYHHTNFDGRDLKNIEVLFGSFAGSTFRNADLRGASFEGALFTHVDMTGALLEGAQFKNAFWSNTICPDGTNSDDNGQTCEGSN